MQGSTHASAGAAVAAGVAVALGSGPTAILICAVAGALVGKLPDQLELGGALRHRKETHSVLAMSLLYILLHRLPVSEVYALALTAAYASHTLLDALTVSGVYWLYPLPHKLRLMPIPLKTGGTVDGLLGLLSLMVTVWIVGQAVWGMI